MNRVWKAGVIFVAATFGLCSAAQAPWTIPSNEAIQTLLAERMQHNGVGVVVGVIDPAGPRVIVYGSSDAANGRALDGDTVFQIGSLTKVFTGLLLADMVRRGEVALDDPAQKYLPAGVKMPQRGRPITLLDLSTHRSGLPSMPTNFRLEADPNPVEAYTVDELWQFLGSYALPREPGEKYEYSNLGVSLLGRLLARRAGMQYEALLKQRVLKPLGMDSTAITVNPRMSARLAPGHSPYLQPVDSWEMKSLNASGSLRSTTNDMLKLLGAYVGLQESRLQGAMLLQRTTRYPANGTTAIAWGAPMIGNEEIYTHEGGKAGYRSAAVFNPRTRTGVVVLQNARTDDRPTALALYLLTGRALPPAPAAPAPKKVVKMTSRALARFAGRYRLGPDEVLTVVAKRDRLLIGYREGHEGLEFLAAAERDFFFNDGNDDITFQVDGGGRVTGLLLYDDGRAAGNSRVATRE
jgi:D-alanyl-D-alanine-carboxypeptidase/D-alanyl-D-alanine-endopeptidase